MNWRWRRYGTVGDRLNNHDGLCPTYTPADSDVTRVMVSNLQRQNEEAAQTTNGQWRFTPSASWNIAHIS